jgi:hypothetical protein
MNEDRDVGSDLNMEEFLDEFHDVYACHELDGILFARKIVEDGQHLASLPPWISTHIDYDGVWNDMRHDYVERNGFYFRA